MDLFVLVLFPDHTHLLFLEKILIGDYFYLMMTNIGIGAMYVINI